MIEYILEPRLLHYGPSHPCSHCQRLTNCGLQRLQLTGALKGLKVIHVAGTKGKVSAIVTLSSLPTGHAALSQGI